jgi:hypothetical protein
LLILTKTIKPARLRVHPMRVVLLGAMNKYGREVKKEFEGTTRTWKHKPKFEAVVSLTGPGPVLLVGTDDQIYQWVDQGTGKYGKRGQAYPIWAGAYTGKSDKEFLVFPSAFFPKTLPGSLKSGTGFRGDPDRRKVMVMHPGIRSRHFSKQIKELNEPKFQRTMEAAMRKARDVSGNPA